MGYKITDTAAAMALEKDKLEKELNSLEAELWEELAHSWLVDDKKLDLIKRYWPHVNVNLSKDKRGYWRLIFSVLVDEKETPPAPPSSPERAEPALPFFPLGEVVYSGAKREAEKEKKRKKKNKALLGLVRSSESDLRRLYNRIRLIKYLHKIVHLL